MRTFRFCVFFVKRYPTPFYTSVDRCIPSSFK